MKTKIIPFDVETAKKIQAGEIEGKIKTKCGNEVRILCFDLIDPRDVSFPIVCALYSDKNVRVVRFTECGRYSGAINSDLDLVIEVPDNESREESRQNFETVAESDAYAEGYENSFRAGRCVAFDDNKCMTLKTNELQFKPFDKVLGKRKSGDWVPDIYSHTCVTSLGRYICLRDIYDQVIPYEGNEHLAGTTNKPKEV